MDAPQTISHGYRHISFDQLDSTNAEAMRRAASGDDGNLWITAKLQTSGKARRGRKWVSEEGNLFASLLLIDPSTLEKFSTLPFVASLAVAQAIETCCGNDIPELSIKWPNDVLIGGKKISGILLESTMLAGGRQAAVIGCGINCRHAPDNNLYPATSLAECGMDATPDQMFIHLHEAMHAALKQWDRGRGFIRTRHAWLQLASGIGNEITVRFDNHEDHGKFLGIDDDGYLLLGTDNEVKTISAADIFFQNHKKTAKKHR